MENKGFAKEMLEKSSNADEEMIAFSLYDGEQIANVTYKQLRKL